MAEQKTYRGSRVDGAVALVAGTALAVGCLGGLALGMADLAGDVWAVLVLVVALLFCALAAWGGVAILLGRVVVDERGLTTSRWPFGLCFTWDAVESWSVVFTAPGETNAYRAVRFTVRGRRWPALVHENEVCRPGFDQFLEGVRAHAGRTREAAPQPALPFL